jgi:hypothetical protein
VIRIKNSYPRFLLKLSLAGVLLKEPPLSVGAKQFPGGSFTHRSPTFFTVHYFVNLRSSCQSRSSGTDD